MYESVRNLLLAGLGAAVLTKDKVLEITRQWVEQGKLSTGEAEKMADDLVEESRQQAKNLGELFDQGLKKAVEALNLAGRQELKDLEARVAALEGEVALLRGRLAGAEPPAPPTPLV
ncbi:MAG: phasin family protein [Desulfarculus sp.]|nr:phasin family protein [Desulfarculus sp.]